MNHVPTTHRVKSLEEPMSSAPTPQKGSTRTFSTPAPSATKVCLAGSFNDWDAEVTPMQRNEYGTWSVTLQLAPGRYEYRFVVDGVWRSEVACEGPHGDCPHCVPNAFGTRNCVVNVF